KATISAPNSSAIFPSILLAEQKKDIELITWETVDTLLAQIQKNKHNLWYFLLIWELIYMQKECHYNL
ncbi:hypothetical protein, partial [Lysinibacillus capsici]|uniref:hypothetical protein n=1 Tax=Lysinibacillus capsici TaxID=2115968 RepID=UPI003BA34049